MKALVLCAGLGTRLHPMTLSQPKCMVDICGKPCLERIVDYLESFGITEVVVNIHWLFPQIMEYFGDRLLYFYEPELLGAEETEKRLQPWLGEKYLVCNGDTLIDWKVLYGLGWEADVEKHTSEAWDQVYAGYKIVVSGTPSQRLTDQHGGRGFWWQDIGTPAGLQKARDHYEKSI